MKQKQTPVILVDTLDILSSDMVKKLLRTEEYQRFAFERAKLTEQADARLKAGGSLADAEILEVNRIVNQYCNDLYVVINKMK